MHDKTAIAYESWRAGYERDVLIDVAAEKISDVGSQSDEVAILLRREVRPGNVAMLAG